jgi:hypothetical protein
MSDNTRMQAAKDKGNALHARIYFSYGRAFEIAKADQHHRWWSQTESNRRPPACKAGALPTELWPRTAINKILGTQQSENGGPGKI